MELKDCKVGMKVRFIDEESHEEEPDFYPEVGTVGTILNVDTCDIYVKWAKGSTSWLDEWHCSAEWVEKVEDIKSLTDDEIWGMLETKMTKNGVKLDCFKTVTGGFTAFNYPLYSKQALIKAVALAYRVGYARAEKGRPFKYGDKKAKANGHWEPVDPNNLPPIGAKLRLARKIGLWVSNIGDIYYRTVKNVYSFNPYEELWVAAEKDRECAICSSEHPERFDYWVED